MNTCTVSHCGGFAWVGTDLCTHHLDLRVSGELWQQTATFSRVENLFGRFEIRFHEKPQSWVVAAVDELDRPLEAHHLASLAACRRWIDKEELPEWNDMSERLPIWGRSSDVPPEV